MPNNVKLGYQADGSLDAIDGPSFADWKTQYLATHGCTETDLRDPSP